ncbi:MULTISPECIES: glycosyltransferase [unclassified Meiothermus]|uniref:UDP-N-acetylglucosamine--N-acetylmuramyl- (pentapeptide) pyrophosphoryl-undecaprenol N-acetylglucosamine transferase n=1 Tax=unclassified Meiothermus TaxID=370471 RepID=UPI000D7D14FC|nr:MULTISPECIES: glycosyltransferase [unclassified Meiothermus]PZA07801.1 UDP-N-acetylglucosamine--N-acetylmuramyl-(pentapeptide) pyrophosphoryl-undecaprenol N-acetylglucosamine transferase [Meiothermus sp. Pnk-1]RYM38897.1 UDP-N-acetylglucosamine--N-acetylmuramyl-(pentapeptide) pyrophosphoryl-undecaprenol N-acetylglucosamine transferase [Meiothermus sp. PNK-Is4]
MILVTGGGTGGHFYPGLAAARALKALGQEVTYVGAVGGLEERVLPNSGFSYRLIPAGKLSREALRPKEGFKVLRGLWEAGKLLRELQPQAVLSTVGYAGFPLAFAAQRMGIPTVIHEQNARLGLSARWLAAGARAIGLAVPMELHRPWQAKAQVVGLPVREERHDPRAAKIALGLEPEKPLILVLGGSQGSLELNQNLPQRLRPLLGEYQVLHQSGPRWESLMQERCGDWRGYTVRGYLDTALAFSAAELAITRAGAATLAEAAYHRVPLLAVPLPAALDGGAQLANARFYARRGAAYMLEQGWEGFQASLAPLLEPSVRQTLRDTIAQLSPEGAAFRLARMVLEVSLHKNAREVTG